MRSLVALCLVASAVAGSVEWASLETRDHHIEAVKAVKVMLQNFIFPDIR